MPALYLAGKNATALIDGVAVKVEAGTVNDSIMIDEVTNNSSGGYYEDIDTIKKATVSGLRIVYDSNAKPTFKAGDLVAVAITIPSGPSLEGDAFRVGSVGVPMLDVKSAVRLTFDLTSQGVYTFDW